MKKPYLISTSAFINDNKRINDYIISINSYEKYKSEFENVVLVETINKNNVTYIDESGFKTFYSPLDNTHPNKGFNWTCHIHYYINNNNQILDDDIIVFITGRYKLINTNIIQLINKHLIKDKYEFLAKEDGDVYDSGLGVHTFIISFTKKIFNDFFNWYIDYINHNECIEWSIKKYMKLNPNRCIILPKETIFGVECNPYYGGGIKKLC